MSRGNAKYKNIHPHSPHGFRDVLKWKLGLKRDTPEHPEADGPPPTCTPDLQAIQLSDESSARVTWIGHSSFLVQLGKINLLIDPVYSNYCSPLPMPGLKRVQPPAIPWDRLPKIHAVLITHSHYDHLDRYVFKRLPLDTQIMAPEALGYWFTRQGFQNVKELPWWKQYHLAGEVSCTSTPAQHASARTPFNRDKSHWCGWMLEWESFKIYFSGDTGYCPVFKEIGERFPAIDLSILPIGAYSPRWLMKPMHTNPADAAQIHLDLQTRLSIACHWGTFRLTDEPLSEPPLLLDKAKKESGIPDEEFRCIAIGETVTVGTK